MMSGQNLGALKCTEQQDEREMQDEHHEKLVMPSIKTSRGKPTTGERKQEAEDVRGYQ